MKTIAVYGSLKLGRYNHALISDEKFLGEARIKTTMYSLGSYPAIVDNGDEGDEHRVELYEVSEPIFTRVYNMEIGAGYKAVEKELTYRSVFSPLEDSQITAIIFYAGKDLQEYCEKHKEIINVY